MYKDKILSALSELKIAYSVRGKEITCKCLNPEHKDTNPSFSINSDNGYYHCFSCGFSGHITKLFPETYLGEESSRTVKYCQALELLEQEAVEDAEEFSESMLPPVDHLVTYDVRGISKELLQSLGVYYCSRGKYKGRLVFPIRDLDGTLIGFDSRIFTPEGYSYIEPQFPNAKYLRPPSVLTKNIVYPLDIVGSTIDFQYIILTEGLFDALSLIELGYPALCNFGLGSPSSHKIGRVLALGVSEIVNGFDGDEKGALGWAKIKEEWRQHLKIARPLKVILDIRKNGKDANDYLVKLKEGKC